MLINFLKWQIYHFIRFRIKDNDICSVKFLWFNLGWHRKTIEKKWHFDGFGCSSITPNQNMIRGKSYSIIEIESR